ncbi:MAG TPA: alanine racemase, partial [Thermoleophilia bacterium]|nr:alanine racemase [Thermoleophilia bacterium]
MKADGYGHGAFEAGSAAVEAGATALVVVTADEALELRERGYGGRLLALGPFMEAQELRSLAAAKVEIALAEEWGLDLLALAAAETRVVGFVPSPAQTATAFRVHLKLESGMHRRGLAESELERTLDRLETLGEVSVDGVMTHLACADEYEASVTRQLAEFNRLSELVRRRWPKAVRHTSNSAATLRHPEAHLDAVRVGVALYGLSPFQRDPERDGLRPALAWHSTLTSIKQLSPG